MEKNVQREAYIERYKLRHHMDSANDAILHISTTSSRSLEWFLSNTSKNVQPNKILP